MGPKEVHTESTPSTVELPKEPDTSASAQNKESSSNKSPDHHREVLTADDATSGTSRKSKWFHRNDRSNVRASQRDGAGDDEEEGTHSVIHPHQGVSEDGGWGVADDAKMSLG